jgi:hypothetical protein
VALGADGANCRRSLQLRTHPRVTVPDLVSRTRLLVLLTALLVASLAATSAADAARRKVPFGFFGIVLPAEMGDPQLVSDSALEQQMALMARSGVESVRVQFGWPRVEAAHGAYNWTASDRLVASAARHRLAVVANVWTTPQWASESPNDPVYWRFPPRDPERYAELMRQFVLRYGPRGNFWTANPSLPRVPIRQWQIWNEQMAPWFWDSRPWYASYTPLLKVAYRSIHGADQRAKVVAGSLVAVGGSHVRPGGYTQWDGMRDLYRAGGKGHFDVIAVHPFTNNPRSVRDTIWRTLEIVRRVRAEMRRRGDRRKPIILTELTWPAAVGKVPRSTLLGLETTPRGQVARLKAVYRRLAQLRRRLRVTQAHWYAWATQYDANSPQSDVTFRFSGLTRFRGGAFSPMPILKTYASTAARYQGCRKTSNARRCR